MITNFYKIVNESLGSSFALPANGLGGSRATSLLVAHFALQNTKFGSEKGKVQKPARIPPQTPPAGGKKAEAGQFHSPRKIVCPAESKLVFRIFVKKCSNFVQKTPHKSNRCLGGFDFARDEHSLGDCARGIRSRSSIFSSISIRENGKRVLNL